MSKRDHDEQAAANAFNRQSPSFDNLYGNDTIVLYKRYRVREHIGRYLPLHSRILELNAGTGEDAVYFAQQGHFVHATDISEGMQDMLARKVRLYGLEEYITYEQCSYTALPVLKNKGPYDLIFSNLAGLNCTDKLYEVMDELPALLKPGGTVVIVILPPFCLWEFLLLFKGKFKPATRRLFSRNGVQAHIEGIFFRCWYYRPATVIRRAKKLFSLLSAEGLCTIVPPSYMEGFVEKHPRLYAFLKKREGQLKGKWPWKYVGDYVILSFRKNGHE